MRDVPARQGTARGARENSGVAPGILEEMSEWLGRKEDFNQSLERAGRVADFLEFAELMCTDALARDESAGAHFREEHQTPDGRSARRRRNHGRGVRVGVSRRRATRLSQTDRESLHFETCI